MPGLLRGVARTAVVAGTATAVSNRVSRRQGQRWEARTQTRTDFPGGTGPEEGPGSAAPVGTDRIAALKGLAELKAQGILTESEFATEKARILAS